MDAIAGRPVIDLGCGTGSVGAAAASVIGARVVLGIDTHPWALDEARDTYAAFGLSASLTRGSASRMRRPRSPSLIVAGYVANEMPDAERHLLRDALIDAVRHGSHVLVIEPLSEARGAVVAGVGGHLHAPIGARADDWTLTLEPPELTVRLGRAAGLTPTLTKLRTIHAAGLIG